MSGGSATVKSLKKIKSILVSQPKPENSRSQYFAIAEDYKIKVDFRPFIHVEGVPGKEFRRTRVYLNEYRSIVLTSRNAIDNYFRVAEELRYKIPESNKYYCLSEAIALYLQKYIQYRKRKIFFGDGKYPKLVELINKHKGDHKYLLPCSDVRNERLSKLLTENEIDFSEAILYRTVVSDLSDLSDIKYDMIVFFSPSGVESLYKNFPDFKQEETRIAAWGKNTAKALEENGLRLDVKAPDVDTPSMTMAIKKYLKQSNKR